MHDVVVRAREARIVARLSETGMVWHDDAKLVSPGLGKIETIHGSRAVEEYDGIAFAGRIHNCLDAIDRVRFTLELAHRLPPPPLTAAALGRRRGITSSAKRVRFFTVFQCGMSATCMTLLM